MRRHISRLAVIGVAAVATAGVAGIAVGAPSGDSGPAQAAPPATQAPANQPVVEHESGIVMEGIGEIRGISYMVTVYENSRYGNSVQVVLGDPDDGAIGYAEQAEPFVVDGVLNASVTINGQLVTLQGSVVPTGRSEKAVDSQTDAGERILTKGTHTALATDVTLSYRGAVSEVSFAPAFAFDLQVRRVQLFGR